MDNYHNFVRHKQQYKVIYNVRSNDHQHNNLMFRQSATKLHVSTAKLSSSGH
jgi:hypothetical protein